MCFFSSLLFFVFIRSASSLPVPDQWKLQMVSLEMCNNQIYKGYICIYEDNFKIFQNGKDCKKSYTFKDSLDNYLRYSRTLLVYTDLLSSSSIYRGLILSLKDPVEIKLEEINFIERINGKYNGYIGGWSKINVITEKELDLLKLQPHSEYCDDGASTYPIFISYSTRFKKYKLVSLYNKYQILTDLEKIKYKKRVLSDSIVILKYTGD